MLTIAFKYILKRLLVTFLIISPIVIFVAWIVLSVKYINMIVYDNISFVAFMRIVLCISPGICGTILPICFLISSIITIHTLQSNKEIIILLTSGKSPLSLLSPLLFLGCCVSVTVLFLNITGAPYAYKTFESLKEQVQTNVMTNFLKIKTFNNIGNSVIYIGARKANVLRNIFISYVPKNQKSNTNIITAREGSVVTENSKTYINLKNGCRQELDKQNDVVATLTFDSLTYEVTHFVSGFYEKSSKVKYKTQDELMQEIKRSPDEQHQTNCLIEYHSRLLTPFVSIMDAIIIGIFLFGARNRGRGRREAIFTFICGIICHISMLILINGNKAVVYNYMIVCALIISQLLFFLKKRN